MVALLDVNVLIALFEPHHVHHEMAHDWFEDQRHAGWATCPVTENGFVRVVTNPAFANPPNRPVDIVHKLAVLRQSGQHHFWSDSLTLTDERVFNAALIRGHKQVTDIYLVGLAKKQGASFATFDRSIPLAAVKGATRANLQVISAVPAESSSGDR